MARGAQALIVRDPASKKTRLISNGLNQCFEHPLGVERWFLQILHFKLGAKGDSYCNRPVRHLYTIHMDGII
jgi:hypothetical protein